MMYTLLYCSRVRCIYFLRLRGLSWDAIHECVRMCTARCDVAAAFNTRYRIDYAILPTSTCKLRSVVLSVSAVVVPTCSEHVSVPRDGKVFAQLVPWPLFRAKGLPSNVIASSISIQRR